MPILRGLRALNIDDCRKHRKNQEKPQNTHVEWAFVEH